MATQTADAAAPGSVDALKRVKAAEAEWDARVSAARTESETTLRQLREESDAAVKGALAEAEQVRSARLDQARAEVTSEVDAIVSEGEKAAELAARGEGRRPADKKDAILDAVLGSFGKD